MPSALVEQVARQLAARARWGPLEYAFWLAALASVFLLPGRHLILTEIAWLALFALSLDLILGYAGIISLGHAAFFGLGSYAAALIAKHGIVGSRCSRSSSPACAPRCWGSPPASWCCAGPISPA
jgi:ABC-type branched-subunit amino acid transport system permease subunit